MSMMGAYAHILELEAEGCRRWFRALSISQLAHVAAEGLRIFQFLYDDGQVEQQHLSQIFWELSCFYYWGLHNDRHRWKVTCGSAFDAIKEPQFKSILELAFDLAASHCGQPISLAVRNEKIDIFKKILAFLKDNEIILVDLRPPRLNLLMAMARRLFGSRHLGWGRQTSFGEPIFSFSFAGLPTVAYESCRLSVRGRAAVALRGLEIYLAENNSSEADLVSQILPRLWNDLAGNEKFEYAWGEPAAIVDELGIEHTALGKMFFSALNIVGSHYYTVIDENTERESTLSLKMLLFLLQKKGIVLKNIDKALRLAPAPRFGPLGRRLEGRSFTRDKIASSIEYETGEPFRGRYPA